MTGRWGPVMGKSLIEVYGIVLARETLASVKTKRDAWTSRYVRGKLFFPSPNY